MSSTAKLGFFLYRKQQQVYKVYKVNKVGASLMRIDRSDVLPVGWGVCLPSLRSIGSSQNDTDFSNETHFSGNVITFSFRLSSLCQIFSPFIVLRERGSVTVKRCVDVSKSSKKSDYLFMRYVQKVNRRHLLRVSRWQTGFRWASRHRIDEQFAAASLAEGAKEPRICP